MARQDDNLLLDDDIDSMFAEDSQQESQVIGGEEEITTVEEVEDEVSIPGQLAVDIYETPEKLVIKSRVAGVNAKDLDIAVENGMLTIQGTLSSGEDASATNWHLQECYWGEFKRTVNLPVKVNEDEVDAILKDGVLTISFTKIAPPRKVITPRSA